MFGGNKGESRQAKGMVVTARVLILKRDFYALKTCCAAIEHICRFNSLQNNSRAWSDPGQPVEIREVPLNFPFFMAPLFFVCKL